MATAENERNCMYPNASVNDRTAPVGGMWQRGVIPKVGAAARIKPCCGVGAASTSGFQEGLGFPSNREGFPYAAAGWSAASLSYWMGDINAAELCRRRLL